MIAFSEYMFITLQYETYKRLNTAKVSGSLVCLVSETTDVESVYHMYVENSRSGIMKRSGMDVDVISDVQTLPVYSVSRIDTSNVGR